MLIFSLIIACGTPLQRSRSHTSDASTSGDSTISGENYTDSGENHTENHFEMIKSLELDKNAHYELIKYCDNNIIFLSTPFDHESIDLLNSLKLPIFKIPSGEITNYPYLKKIAGLNKKVILSRVSCVPLAPGI